MDKEAHIEYLKQLFEGIEAITVVLKNITTNDRWYSVLIVKDGKIVCIDNILADAGLFTYKIFKSSPNGIRAYDDWAIANRLTSVLGKKIFVDGMIY